MPKRILVRSFLGFAAVCLGAATASAHPGLGPQNGLTAGFMHPLTGVDHILAMLAVGVFAANLGRRALWLVPLAFMAMMAVGGMLGITGVRLPLAEAMVALSVVILGLAVAIPRRCPVLAAMLMVGVFGLFHGHTHGAEMQATVSALEYGVGFLLATAMLHTCGIALGLGIGHAPTERAMRLSQFAGLVTAAIGLGLLTGGI